MLLIKKVVPAFFFTHINLLTMYFLIEKFGLIPGWFLGALFIFMRYAFIAGSFFLIFYVIWRRRFSGLKIQDKMPATARIWSEIGHSLSTAFIFALVGVGIYGLRRLGLTAMYTDADAYGGWPYLLGSFLLLTFIHDTYFYWMHRALHHPKLFRIFHRVHHQSHNPTPWASLAFHPLESLAEIAIVPLVILIIPFHPLVLFAFAFWSLFFNIIGHLGYELFPAGFVDHPVGKWFNTATHHNMHHAQAGCNYGLYYNIWDRWMGTNHPDYEKKYRSITLAGRNLNIQPKDCPTPGGQAIKTGLSTS